MALNPEEPTPTLREDLPDHLPAFTKILFANRGEIAVRAFRAAYESGSRSAGRCR